MKPVIVQTQKNVGISIILVLLLGPIGLFYSTIKKAILTVFAFTLIMLWCLATGKIATTLIILLPYYAACIFISVKEVNKYNRKLLNGESVEEDFTNIVGELLLMLFLMCMIYAFYDKVLL